SSRAPSWRTRSPRSSRTDSGADWHFREDVGAREVEAEVALDGRALRERILVAPRDVVNDRVADLRRPPRRDALVVAVARGVALVQDVGTNEPRRDVEHRGERGLEEDHRVVGVDERRARDRDAQLARRRATIDAVVWVRWIVHELPALF